MLAFSKTEQQGAPVIKESDCRLCALLEAVATSPVSSNWMVRPTATST